MNNHSLSRRLAIPLALLAPLALICLGLSTMALAQDDHSYQTHQAQGEQHETHQTHDHGGHEKNMDHGGTMGTTANNGDENGENGDESTNQQPIYIGPMHPQITSNKPGKCPICGMDLVVAKQSKKSATHPDMDTTSVNPQMQQLIGVKTTTAKYHYFGQELRGFAQIFENPENRMDIAPKTGGWIKELTVFDDGDPIAEGQVLFTLYSPELISAQKDYLAAKKSGAATRRFATRQRLRLIGMDEPAIEKLDNRNTAFDQVPFHAPMDGVAVNPMVSTGSYLSPGQRAMSVTNYDSLWVVVEISERWLSLIKPGDRANVVPSFPGAMPMTANIDYIYPAIDNQTRRGRVRIVVDTSGHADPSQSPRPGGYADVIISANADRRLAVPSNAILYDQAGGHIIQQTEDGTMLSIPVETGIQADGMTEITDGIDPGDTIISSGQFLIDADIRLNSNLKSAGGGHAGH